MKHVSLYLTFVVLWALAAGPASAQGQPAQGPPAYSGDVVSHTVNGAPDSGTTTTLPDGSTQTTYSDGWTRIQEPNQGFGFDETKITEKDEQGRTRAITIINRDKKLVHRTIVKYGADGSKVLVHYAYSRNGGMAITSENMPAPPPSSGYETGSSGPPPGSGGPPPGSGGGPSFGGFGFGVGVGGGGGGGDRSGGGDHSGHKP